MINFRKRDTIDTNGWTNDDTDWQPARTQIKPMPNYIEPTDEGYLGLEPPVG